MRRRVIIVLLLVALVTSGVVAWASDRLAEPTSTPVEQATFGVAGPDGRPVVCANGKELRVSRDELFAKPTHDPTKVKPVIDRGSANEEEVWRCGTGANPHLNPRLIPASKDPLSADARSTP